MQTIIRQVRMQAGVTLIELLVALSLLSVVVGTLSVIVITGVRAARTTNDFLQTQAHVRAGLDQVTDEVRWGESVTAATGASVTVFVPQSTPFSPNSPYAVTFAYDAAARTITRQEDPDAGGPAPFGSAVPIAYLVVQRDGTAGLGFEYFDRVATALGSTPADLGAVARVRIIVSTTSNGITRSMAGDVALRGRQN
jgi:prepilin-type N-terminal cleavage/methylation domain-containing protein